MVALFLSGFDLLFLFVPPLGCCFTGIWSFYLKPKSLYLIAIVTHNCNEKCLNCNEKVSIAMKKYSHCHYPQMQKIMNCFICHKVSKTISIYNKM